jgi:molybdopterin molybdotransferase
MNYAAVRLPPDRLRLSVEAYLETVLSLVTPLDAEQVPLADGLGRHLERPIHSASAIPPFDNSAMDGYALGGSGEAFELVADVPAGDTRSLSLSPGEAAQVMTGAPLPRGTRAVLPVEHAQVQAGRLGATGPVRAGQHIRRRGEDAAQGQLVLPTGTRLGPVQLAAAAACGADFVWVRPRPRVALVVTGSELTRPGDWLAAGAIYDSNSVLLTAACAAAGAAVVSLEHLSDQAKHTADALEQAGQGADLIVVSGGVSAGVHDYVRDAITALSGTVAAVAMRPGKPQACGRTSSGVPMIALPGNPVSSAVSFAVFVRPALGRLSGLPDGCSHQCGEALAGTDWTSPGRLRQYVPVRVRADESSTTWAEPVFPGASGSHRVAALARAEALAVVPEAITEVRRGDRLSLTRLP